MSRLPLIEARYSGRVSTRVTWRGKVVLRVEMAFDEYNPCPPMPGSDPAEWKKKMLERTTYTWRDATAHDLDMLGIGAGALDVAGKGARS